MSAPLSNGLSLRGVSRRFGARMAVAGVTLDVPRGAVLCILGPSGCGKSTTLRIAAGLERPDEGSVYIGGRLVEGEGTHVPPDERGIGLMFQDYALFPHLSARGNVAFGLHRLPRRERDRRAMEELGSVGLTHLADAYPHTLSGGEQQRVALARMLAPRPDVVLMDEPFSGLDVSLREQVRATTLKRLREANAASVIVTHDPDEAMRLGDRVAVMREGRIVQEGSPLSLYRTPADAVVAALFGGANVFHAEVRNGLAATPFGPARAALRDGEQAEVLFRPGQVRVSGSGVSARVLSVCPVAGGIEVEAALAPDSVPAGVESPAAVRASAALDAGLAPGAYVHLEADPKDAFVFACLGKASRG